MHYQCKLGSGDGKMSGGSFVGVEGSGVGI